MTSSAPGRAFRMTLRTLRNTGCDAFGWEAMYSATDLLFVFDIVLPQFAVADLILQAPRRILNL